MLQDSFMIQASDRLGALFGVSILDDKGHARNELWYVVYQMSSVTQSRYIYRVITSVPTFFVRVLGKLLDGRILLDEINLI
jgi:hypothetical protein